MRVLIIGSGGREHAFAWKISQSRKVSKVYIAPGNAGTLKAGENVKLNPASFDEIKTFVLNKGVNMVLVGPEAPLVQGIRDFFEGDSELNEVPVIGPDMKGAMLEGSKDFAKDFMVRYGIPTAAYKSFSSGQMDEAAAYLKTINPPYVLKADGLAAGKGVLILDNYDEAVDELKLMFDGKFGEAGNKVVIEEFLSGIELSVFVLTDGKDYKILPEAKDYKRIGEGDTGLNTGGMGAVSPVPFADDVFLEKVEERIVKPTLKGLREEGIDYRGFIFVGLMNCNGEPKVIEYNVRMGDPEAEVVIPRIESDLFDLIDGVAKGTLASKEMKITKDTVTTVMLVSGGYPEKYEKGYVIGGLDSVGEESILFHAGTSYEDEKTITSGGRVIAVSSAASDMKKALGYSYMNAEKVTFKGKYYRKDIGFDLNK